MSRLPSISIVVPNLNGGATLSATLQSLVDQDYPALEIVVVDGGSADDSVDVIRRFERHLTWWVSEPDRGQASAINKGFAHCHGEIVNWLCSDDYLMPGALAAVGKAFAESPRTEVLVGRCRNLHLQQDLIRIDSPTIFSPRRCPLDFAQPSCFYRRSLLRPGAPLDEEYQYAMDCELWSYFESKPVRWSVLDEVLSTYVWSSSNKTSTGGWKIVDELERADRKYNRELIPITFWHRLITYPLFQWRHRNPTRLRAAAHGVVTRAMLFALAPFYGTRRVVDTDWSGLLGGH